MFGLFSYPGALTQVACSNLQVVLFRCVPERRAYAGPGVLSGKPPVSLRVCVDTDWQRSANGRCHWEHLVHTSAGSCHLQFAAGGAMGWCAALPGRIRDLGDRG